MGREWYEDGKEAKDMMVHATMSLWGSDRTMRSRLVAEAPLGANAFRG